MIKIKSKLLLFFVAILCCTQSFSQAKGNLFIIGGGTRTPQLMRTMLATANLSSKDYIVVLPMATEEPDTAFYYFKISVDTLCKNVLVKFNFTAKDTNNQSWLDSVKNAKLIFITGGDQSRFMNIVLHTPVQQAIKQAYKNGATIGGTSAGAAMMSRYMLTGNQLLGDTTYESTFPKLWYKNIEIKEGLGLLDSAIIDQHFVARSRYNRLFSAVAQFPSLPCIGIDESTAIIVHGNNVTVAGESQVIVYTHPKNLTVTQKGLIKFDDIEMHIYTAGDTFQLK
ncbi:MAG TPA: cyanophycinase [Chitinophagaceae bacterium]|jgi:cyanophycinase